MKFTYLFICILVLLTGCGGKNGSTLDPIHENALLENQSFSVSNVERQYHLYLPADPGTAAIVILLHGNGGSSDQILGLTGLVALKPVNSECAESTVPLSVLMMNGTDDPILPYNGGQIGSDRGEVFSAAETTNYWTNRNQSKPTPIEIDIAVSDPNDESTVKRYSYISGTDSTVVKRYEVVGGGHTEPSIAQRYSALYKLIVGNQNGDIEMATEVWGFFESL